MNSSNLKPPINVPDWIQKHERDFLPPICNKMLYNDQLKVFFVGGPNQRKDYHIELGEEFFYQLQGDMCLNIVERGQHKPIWIRQGEVFLLPARIPHSPQRQASTMGLVIERERATNELDGLRYYCEDDGTKNTNSSSSSSSSILYERWFHCIDLGTQLAPIIKAYHESEEYRTGLPSTKNSRLIEPPPPYSDDTTTMVDDPISLTEWLRCNHQEIDHVGHKPLFEDNNGHGHHNHHRQTRINVFGGNFKHLISGSKDHHLGDGGAAGAETFLWQIAGTAYIQPQPQQLKQQQLRSAQCSIRKLEVGHCLNVPANIPIQLETQSGCFTMVLSMPTPATPTPTTPPTPTIPPTPTTPPTPPSPSSSS